MKLTIIGANKNSYETALCADEKDVEEVLVEKYKEDGN